MSVKCPCCGWSGKRFLPKYIPTVRKRRGNEVCPGCGSRKRHRLYYLYLKPILEQRRKLKVLHFAPERCLANLFKSYSNVNYLSADLMGPAMVREDMTDLSFAGNTFDIVFASHVLEHIEEDRRAMAEVYRVLKPAGFAILQVPILDRDVTFEDSSVKTEEDRERIFGQKDHVRIYGRDYGDRLRAAGFDLKIEKFSDSLPEETIKKYALSREDIHLCSKKNQD